MTSTNLNSTKQATLFRRARNFFQQVLGRPGRPPITEPPTVNSRAFARYARRFDDEGRRLITELVDERITLEQFADAGRLEINRLHTTAYTIGRGGASELSLDDLRAIDRKVAEQIRFFDNWVAQLDGQPLTDADIQKMVNRWRMYGNAANATLQQATVDRLGMPPLPAYPGDGSTICRANDKCRWKIVKLEGAGNFDCYWQLSPAEHCDTCIARAAAWNPLKIRSGIIQPYNPLGLFR